MEGNLYGFASSGIFYDINEGWPRWKRRNSDLELTRNR